MNISDFEKVSLDLSSGTSIIVNREEINRRASNFSVGDFLSRIWSYFGRPNIVAYEGFSYTFRHKPSGLIFTAYSGGSGPAYGGFQQNREKLIAVFTEFENLLMQATLVDCEIKYETDSGWFRSGAKDGKPYDAAVVCPKCDESEGVIPIAYGRFADNSELGKMVEEGKVYRGGCEIRPGNPLWYCERCKIKF